MAKKIEDLEVDEISLCDLGANRGAKVVIFKRDNSGDDGELIQKCLAAVAKEDITGLQASDFADALDELARGHAERTGQGFHAAYAEAAASPEGSALYTGLLGAQMLAQQQH